MKLLLADDHGLVRHGLQLLIAEVLPQLRVQLAGSLADAVLLSSKYRRIVHTLFQAFDFWQV